MSFRPACLVPFAACALLLSACGSKGPLTLPAATSPAQPAAPAKAASDHNSTPTPPASQ